MKHRSILTAAAKYKKDNTKKKLAKKYCMFFNRFGKCERGSNCPFVHDPDRVAVCTRSVFKIRGENFLHDPDRVAVCTQSVFKIKGDNC